MYACVSADTREQILPRFLSSPSKKIPPPWSIGDHLSRSCQPTRTHRDRPNSNPSSVPPWTSWTSRWRGGGEEMVFPVSSGSGDLDHKSRWQEPVPTTPARPTADMLFGYANESRFHQPSCSCSCSCIGEAIKHGKEVLPLVTNHGPHQSKGSGLKGQGPSCPWQVVLLLGRQGAHGIWPVIPSPFPRPKSCHLNMTCLPADPNGEYLKRGTPQTPDSMANGEDWQPLHIYHRFAYAISQLQTP